MKTHFQILIIGGGNAGNSVATQLLIKDPNLEIGIIEPSERHYYQPAWTLVGGSEFEVEDTIRNEADVIPEKVEWIKPERKYPLITHRMEKVFKVNCCLFRSNWIDNSIGFDNYINN